eukprot:scaffold1386_cov55-Attheya_sp.AAC.5
MIVSTAKAAFLSWCAAQGVSKPLELQWEDTNGINKAPYRYMTCDADVSPGDDILRVPLKACLQADTLEALAERLAHERSLGPNSDYAPYLDVLPTVEDGLENLPRFWSSGRLDSVTDGGLLLKRLASDERKDLDPWALACVDSRANYVKTKEGKDTYAMTPMLDMFNHDGIVSTKARVSVEEEDMDVLSLQVNAPFSKGSQVYISYGDLSNLDTLCDYGFISSDSDTPNPCNYESLNVQLIRRPPFQVTVFLDGSVDVASLANLRSYLADAEDLKILVDDNGDANASMGLGAFSKPLSERNELDVQSFLASTLDEAIEMARSGAETAEGAGDLLVANYLSQRATLLDKGLERIKQNCPGLEF